LQKFVLARIVTMTGIDIGLFDYDRHNSIYFFATNADEQIYLRYGGRDATDPNTYLHLESFELALLAGLRQHELYLGGKLPRQPRSQPFFPEQIVSLKKNVIERDRCVECHLIGDYSAQDQEKAGTLDKRRTLYRSPDVKTLGVHLEVPKGLAVAKAEGPAAAAGLSAGDILVAFDGAPVLTFGDLQYRMGELNRDAQRVRLTARRGERNIELDLALPREWWHIETGHRYWTVEPMVYFTTRPLTAERSAQMKIPAGQWASEVVEVDPLAASLKIHTLRVGDVITGVNGIRQSTVTAFPERYLKLTVRAGDTAKVHYIREGGAALMEIRTHRQYFRKERSE
jgi:hypothetical protein